MHEILVERRKCPRYRCQNNWVRLGWWQKYEPSTARTRLFDISRCGISLATGLTMPTSGTVWLSLGVPTPTLWIWADIVRQDESNRVGLAFPNDSSLDVFHAVTLAFGFEEFFGP